MLWHDIHVDAEDAEALGNDKVLTGVLKATVLVAVDVCVANIQSTYGCVTDSSVCVAQPQQLELD